MVTLDGLKLFTPENARHTIPLSKVSTVAFFCSSNVPVFISLANPDGEIIPCGTIPPHSLELHKLELRNFHGLFLEADQPEDKNEPFWFNLHCDVRHSVGEPISDVPLAGAVTTPRQLSERERTRRTVMQTLMTLKVMPDQDELEALEASLGFDFEADEFGDFLEEPPELVQDDSEPPSPEPKAKKPPADPDPEPDGEPPQSSS